MREGSGSNSISVHLSSHEGNFKILYGSFMGRRDFWQMKNTPSPRGLSEVIVHHCIFLRADWPTLVTRYDFAQVLFEGRIPIRV